MSINKTGVCQIVGRLATQLVSIPFIIAKQNAPRPSGIYVLVNLFSSIGLGWDEVNHEDRVIDVDLNETIEGFRQLSFSFNFYRDGAYENATKFRTLLQSSESEEYLKENGFGLGTRGQIRELDAEISKNYEERSQIDIDFFVVDSETLVTRSIQSVEIDGTMESSGRQNNITIDVP